MLTPEEVAFLKEELKKAKNPLFFYDDDGDGLCSFLLLYRINHRGKGFLLKSTPKLDLAFFRQVEEHQPDKIFILDVPLVEQEFIDQANRPIFWIDHHTPQQHSNVHYFNSRVRSPDSYIPTTRLAYQVSQDPADLWIAAVGCLFDWHMPDFMEEFIQKYPTLLPAKADLSAAVYQHPIGKLVRIFSFLLKGHSPDVTKSVKILTRIKTPEEILSQETPAGRFLFERFEEINEKYLNLLKKAEESVKSKKLVFFSYDEKQWSFTADLANEMVNRHPEKVVIICRKKSGEMKCSLRARFPILGPLEKALIGIKGYGGGHPQACGANIKEEDWNLFLKNFQRELGC